MSDKPIGLVIPTRWEAAPILRRYNFKSVGGSLYKGTVHSHPVVICISGVGRKAADKASSKLVSEGAKVLVSAGFCGALVPSLHVGDLVTDRLITVDQPARTPAERTQLTTRANALAVDMETQAVIEVGTRKGVPIYILRVVSDECSDDLTPLFGTRGTFSAMGIALRLLNPQVWPLAIKLRKQSQVAGERLSAALDAFCLAPLP